MNLFYASFIPGLQNVIADVIKERLLDVVIHKLLDGAVIFETAVTYDKLNFFCFNNIFAMIDLFDEILAKAQRRKDREELLLENYIENIIDNFTDSEVISNNSKNIQTFRIVVSSENSPAAIGEKLRVEAEKYISRLSGLKPDRSKPDTEFWFLYRKEKDNNDFFIFMKRLTLRSSWEKTLHKGELPPPLAWTLCRLANLVHSDTVLDPFCGYGSIPHSALKHFHIKKFIACDNNKEAAFYTMSKFTKNKKDNFIFYKNDFFDLPSFIPEKSIDVIITDPPWGQYRSVVPETNDSENNFYEKMFDVFGRLLKDGGRAVILFLKDFDIKMILSCFEIKNSVPVLLSGKKAVIYVLEKN